MAVYIVLFLAVVGIGLLVRNRDYVQFHIGKPGEKAGLQIPRDRQRACNISAAVAIFALLAAVSACRIAVGNDYWVYRFQFNLIMQNRHVSYEPGFNLVVWVIQSLFGYDNYLPVFGFFSVVTAIFFVKAMYDQGEWFAATVFLLMTGGYYYSSLNSVRYYFVLAIAMYAMKYVLRKQYGVFIAWIVFAALFHKSILVVIPIYLLAHYLAEHKIPKGLYVLGGAFLVSLVVFKEFYRRIIFFFYPFYEGSAFDKVDISFTNIAKCMGVLVLCMFFLKVALKDNVQTKFYFFLNLAGLAVYTFGSFIPEVSRIGYYMIVSQVFLVPSVLIRIENKGWKLFWTIGVAVAFLGYFGLFLHSAYNMDIRLLPYLNWIFN
ncbi:MAG: EpsG family protein [Lachnospiraceae bacterium]|nr:EpsG family protein [Lachnospiraceae bacterium]